MQNKHVKQTTHLSHKNKSHNKLWWAGMGLLIAGVVVAILGVVLLMLGMKRLELLMPFWCIGGAGALTSIVLWIVSAKENLRKNPYISKASLILWIITLVISIIGAIFMILGFARIILGPNKNAYMISLVVFTSLGCIFTLIFLPMWLVTRVKKSHITSKKH